MIDFHRPAYRALAPPKCAISQELGTDFAIDQSRSCRVSFQLDSFGDRTIGRLREPPRLLSPRDGKEPRPVRGKNDSFRPSH